MHEVKKILDLFNLNKEEEDIFLCLFSFGEQSVAETAKNSNTKRTTTYGIVGKLKEKNLIEEVLKSSVKKYRIVDKEILKKRLDSKISEIKEAKDTIESVFTSLSGLKSNKPEIKFFQGKEGVQFVLNDLIIKQNIETESFWPIEKMIKILGKDYFRFLNKERIKRNIYTRAIWPAKQIIDTKIHPYLGSGEEFLREIRIAPKGINFSLGYWIYENNVVFISSEKEVYAFIIKSDEFSDMLRKQFNIIWDTSKKLKQKMNNEMKDFLKEKK